MLSVGLFPAAFFVLTLHLSIIEVPFHRQLPSILGHSYLGRCRHVLTRLTPRNRRGEEVGHGSILLKGSTGLARRGRRLNVLGTSRIKVIVDESLLHIFAANRALNHLRVFIPGTVTCAPPATSLLLADETPREIDIAVVWEPTKRIATRVAERVCLVARRGDRADLGRGEIPPVAF